MPTAPRRGLSRGWCLSAALLALIPAAAAPASEPSAAAAAPSEFSRAADKPSFALPRNYAFAAAPEAKSFSASDLHPRAAAAGSSESRLDLPGGSLMHDAPVWQRLTDFRTLGRVRLLTLWKSSGSSVSVQAGAHGSPTLQWTSRMTHAGNNESLLDRLFPVPSLGDSSSPFHGSPHAAAAAQLPTVKSAPATAAAQRPSAAAQ